MTTRVPFVGRAVPHVRAGVGAVCTQASTMVEFGPRGLDLLAKGVEPKDALAQLLASDEQRESRQVGIIDMKGRTAAHTGKQNNAWAGSRQGKTYTTQANIMVGPEVLEAVAATFEASEGTGMPLAERMILALEAGYAKGGDKRWGNLQSAAIKIADPERSRPRRRLHHARDRSGREPGAGRRAEAHLLHDRPAARLSRASRASKAPTSSS